MDLLRRALGSRGEPKPPRLDRTYAGLRSMVLGLDARKAGAEPTADLPDVYGVVVDWNVGSGFATFVALADGTASMYTSTGGGTIGAGGRPGIEAAGAALLRTAQTHLDRFERVDAPGPPVAGGVVYWVLTYAGLRAAAHDAAGPPVDAPHLQELGAAFQDYVTAFRLLEQLD